MKFKTVKKLLACICAFTAVGSTISAVGAIKDDENVEKFIRKIDECDISIQKLEQKKSNFDKKSNKQLQELRQKISNNMETLKYFKNLLDTGNEEYGSKEDITRECNGLQQGIKLDVKQEKEVINKKIKVIKEIDNELNVIKTKRQVLVNKLEELFDEQAENKNQNDEQNDSEQQTIEMWKRIASGCQYDSSGQFENLCWLFSATNVINYFGEVDINNKQDPTKGIDNIVDNYLNSNGDFEKLLNKKTEVSETIEKYLNMNGVKTCSVLNSITPNYFGNRDETKQAVVDIVKTQISTHFNANKNRVNRKSPVLCCKNSHWVSIVGYFENTGNVVIVDSSNGYKQDSRIYVQNIDDFIKTNLINEDKNYGFTAEMIFSSKDEKVDSKRFDVYSVDNFEQMDEVNNMLSTYF